MATDLPAGAAFLLEPVGTRRIFTPEDFTDEQIMFKKSADDFMRNEILPLSDRIEAKEEGLLKELILKAGELGLCMIDVPEKYEGMGLDKVTSMLAAESVAAQGSFAATIGAHTGIGTLPIVYFGTEEQKQKYLPKLATGEMIAAYALTEAGSGSDALSAKTKAVLTDDGEHYIINGSKMWITNGNISDVYIIFAKIDGDKFTGFIIDKDTEGFSQGAEEHKMGIRGSSTCALTFEDCKVPVGNVLGEIGKGHRIAFNILNIGRLKLGLAVLGAGKNVLEECVGYAKERKQFGKPLADFGLIQAKLADIMVKIYVTEAAGYRTAGLIDDAIKPLDKNADDYDKKVIKAVEEYNIEASILKVYGSERMSEAADEAVQVHGGYGYSQEYVVERTYRDARINRIFEGTNEINRMLIPGTVIKRSMQQRLPLVQAFETAKKRMADAAELPQFDGPLAAEKTMTETAKAATLWAFNHAFMKYMVKLADQQEVLACLADLMMDCFAMDSVIARVEQTAKEGDLQYDLAKVAVHEIYNGLSGQLKRIVDDVSDEKEAAERHAVINNMALAPYFSILEAKRRIAAHALDVERYPY